ncbi:MAG: hypothetical protein DRO11_08510 [Methanobacteriota archaeon]|nr:MAG: hypothetical protein DRO11_08510 [Euryarchaeota archaeon]
MKKVWITALAHDEKNVQQILSLSKRYGLDANGHFWVDDLKNMAWLTPKEKMIDPETALWVIMGSQKEIGTDSIRYGLALLALSVQARKGHGFHIIWISTEGEVDVEKLPTPLQGVEVIGSSDPTLGAKLVALANTPVEKIDTEYRLDIHANPGFGQWVEVGPGKGQKWDGALLGVQDAEIDAHGVGSAGRLPQRSVLEYPVRGLKLKLGDREYTAWAVQNALDETLSYYVRIKGKPVSILFGSHTAEDNAQFYLIAF